MFPMLAACGSPGPTTYDVSGEVTFEGVPLSHGEIIFRDDAAGTYAGKIIDGNYSVQCTAGDKRVEITSSGISKEENMSPSGEPVIEFAVQVPPKYNVQSDLTANISNGPNKFDFELGP